MATAKNVTVIPATFNPQTRRPLKQVTRRRVAGYARVSTDSDEQFTSYEAQVDYLDAEFTDARCIAMLDHVSIYADGRMVYSFLNGSDITVML